MKSLWIITKNELKRYFTSPLAYVYLVTFLILNGSFAIYFGHFLSRGRADLLPMFSFQPWLYLLFISGISMRLWAEEFRSRTVVQLLTMPVTINNLVWGKFFASWLFCAIALVLTFPFWICVNILGSPDNMVIILSYIGSLLLAGAMLAISQTMSALTKNQVIALVFAVIANLIFFLSSLEYVLALFRLFVPLPIVDLIASFSFITHFDNITRGLIEMRDLVFFTSIILLFNFITEMIISFKTSGVSKFLQSSSPRQGIIFFILLLVGFVGVNLLANAYLRNIQFDATQEKIYSLSTTTKQILQNLPHQVKGKIYYSKILEQRNPEFRNHFDKIRLLLEQYRKISNNKFTYDIYYVEPLSDEEDFALAAGLHPLPLVDKSQNALFGMIVTDSINNQKKIPFFTLERQDFIEQDLTEIIYILNNKKKNLGLVTSLPMSGEAIENVMTPRWEIIRQLDKFYNVKEIKDAKQFKQHNFDVLMIVHPIDLADELVDEIIKYGNSGGKVLLFADIAAEAIRNIAPTATRFKSSEIQKMSKAWGFFFYPEVVVADLENSLTVDASSDYKKNTNFTQDVMQFLLKEKNFNPIDNITTNLRKILFSSASVIEPDETRSDIEFIPLIMAGKKSAIMNAELIRDNVNPADILRYFEPDNYHKIIAARLKNNNKFDVIVVADSDLLYDTYWGHQLSMTGSEYFVPVLDNANFVLNALDALVENNLFSSLRGRAGKIRSFERLEQLRKDGLKEFQIKEQEILENIQKTKNALQEVWNKKNFENRDNFSADELSLIAGTRKNLAALRKELRDIRANTNENIQTIELLVKFSTIYLIPLILLSGVVLLIFFKSGRKISTPQTTKSISKKLLAFGGISLIIFACGIFSALSENMNRSNITGKPVFGKLQTNINSVDKIILKNAKEQLILQKINGTWVLNNSDVPVFQDRVRSFLSALIEAQYFEKKSSEAKYLGRFGLLPIDEPNATGINVTLQNKDGKNIESFIIGDYDIDVGRGSRAAYMRFDNQFQVWQIIADFVDLSLEQKDWTYATLWNLRLGRFVETDKHDNINNLINLAKKMLNTSIIATTNKFNTQKLFEFDLLTEGDNEIKLGAWQDNNKYYISYDFKYIPNDSRLQIFEKYTKGKFLEISKKDMKELEYVIKKFD